MRSFRIRLILALIAGITLVSLAFTYFEVLAHKLTLRRELVLRTLWIGNALQPDIEMALTQGKVPDIDASAAKLRTQGEALGLAVYDASGAPVVEGGPKDIFNAFPPGPRKQAIRTGKNAGAFGRTGDIRWLDQAIPLHVNGAPAGALVLLEDAGYISAEAAGVWLQSFWRTAALLSVIVAVAYLIV